MPLVKFVLTYFVFALSLLQISAQDLLYKASFGGGISTIVNSNGIAGNGFNYTLNLGVEHPIQPTGNWFLECVLGYTNLTITNYKNEPYYYMFQQTIPVNSNFKNHYLNSMFMLRYRPNKSKFSVGVGLNIYVLLASQFQQDYLKQYDSTMIDFIRFNYEINSTEGVHKFNRFNTALTFSMGYEIAKKISLGVNTELTLFKPNEIYMNYQTFRLWNNSLFLIYKFN